MKKGLSRFNSCLQQVQDLMDKARAGDDPAKWLFQNGGRTPFFMLEALSRLYAGLHNRKKFDKLKSCFKELEDGLGEIDYYVSLSESFKSEKNIPAGCKNFVNLRLEKSYSSLNNILTERGWVSEDHLRIRKIKGKLKNADWLKPEKEVDEIARFYKKEIKVINKFVNKSGYLFDNVEKDVHELRRKLRWLSIYPQAMLGVFQFDATSPAAAHLKKYLTTEITESPFNKLPPPGHNTSFVILNKNYFLALSWMIAELGKLKDEGLLITGFAEAMKTINETYSLPDDNKKRIQEILGQAESITKTFIKEKNLDKLLIKTNKARKKIIKYAKK